LFSALNILKGTPTFFFTFSAADNYWPDLHQLLQEPNNATPSIRIRALNLTDSYFVSRLNEIFLLSFLSIRHLATYVALLGVERWDPFE